MTYSEAVIKYPNKNSLEEEACSSQLKGWIHQDREITATRAWASGHIASALKKERMMQAATMSLSPGTSEVNLI